MSKRKQIPVKAGIDLGTANTLLYIEGNGVMFNEPSMVAYNVRTNELLAVGIKAKHMEGKVHKQIKILKPLSGGVISDLDAAKDILKYIFQHLDRLNADLANSTLLICCPSEVTGIEREAMIDLANHIGIKDVFIEEEVKAGAIGAGLDIFSANGTMVIDSGGGSTDVGVFSVGDIVVSESIRIAGNAFDEEIIKYVQYEHGLIIGKATAERIKIQIGTVKSKITTGEGERTVQATGRDLISGLPKRIYLKQSEIRDVLIPLFNEIALTALKVLQKTPPELSADIIKNGVLLTGGGALIDGAAAYYHEKLQLDVRVAENALTAICDGTKTLLRNRGTYLRVAD